MLVMKALSILMSVLIAGVSLPFEDNHISNINTHGNYNKDGQTLNEESPNSETYDDTMDSETLVIETEDRESFKNEILEEESALFYVETIIQEELQDDVSESLI